MTTPLHVSCFSDFRSWLRKHKKTVLITAGVAGAGVCAYYWWSSGYQKVKEEEKQLKKFEEQAEVHAVAQIQNHFDSIQEISDTTTLPSVLAHVKQRLFELVDLTVLTDKLMSVKESGHDLPPREKVLVWQELKVLSFTRTAVAMWAVSLLDLFVRMQLNILGRHVYIGTSLMSGQTKEGELLPMSCQHKFIAFADYLSHDGLELLVSDLHSIVERLVKGKPLKQPYNLEQLVNVFKAVKEEFGGRQVDWSQYVVPKTNVLPAELARASSLADSMRLLPDASIASIDDDHRMLDALMMETRRILASTEFHVVLMASVEAVIDKAREELQPLFDGGAGTPLVKLLPPIASVGTSLFEDVESNSYVASLAELEQLKKFCAVIYADKCGLLDV